MKNIIISGPSRAGKSTLARKINETLGYSAISVDQLVATFQGAYPHMNIGLGMDRKRTAANVAPFLGHYLGVLSSSQGANKGNGFVMEGGYLGYYNLETILPIVQLYGIDEMKDSFLLIGLVQNLKTADAFFSDFREFDTKNDWTYHLADDDLREISEEAIAYSRSMTDYLAKHGFTLYDTSVDRERVLDRIVEGIRSELG